MRDKQVKIALVILAIVIFGVIAFILIKSSNTTLPFASNNSEVSWAFDGKRWQASSTPPDCPEPLEFPSPVDVSLASGILYPGQMRGNDYKPHGGFRFDSRETNNIEVRAIMDGYILKASRYDDGGEIQNFMFYVNPCGIMVMHDHLLTLSPKLERVFEKLPVGQNGNSRTTSIEPKVYIEKDEILATEVGYKKDKNIFLDLGLYDLRKTNGIQYDDAFRAENPSINEYGAHALCWLDSLSEKEKIIIKNLPAGGHEGKVSDYCQ